MEAFKSQIAETEEHGHEDAHTGGGVDGIRDQNTELISFTNEDELSCVTWQNLARCVPSQNIPVY